MIITGEPNYFAQDKIDGFAEVGKAYVYASNKKANKE